MINSEVLTFIYFHAKSVIFSNITFFNILLMLKITWNWFNQFRLLASVPSLFHWSTNAFSLVNPRIFPISTTYLKPAFRDLTKRAAISWRVQSVLELIRWVFKFWLAVEWQPIRIEFEILFQTDYTRESDNLKNHTSERGTKLPPLPNSK